MFQVMATWKKLLYNVNVNVMLLLDLHYPKPGEQYVPSTCYTDSRWTMYSDQSDLVRPDTPVPFHPSLAAFTTLSLGVSFPSTSFAKSGGGQWYILSEFSQKSDSLTQSYGYYTICPLLGTIIDIYFFNVWKHSKSKSFVNATSYGANKKMYSPAHHTLRCK